MLKEIIDSSVKYIALSNNSLWSN